MFLLRSRLFLPIALAAAAGVPYVSMNPDLKGKAESWWKSMSSTDEVQAVSLTEAEHVPQAERPDHSIREHRTTPSTSPLFTPSVQDMRDVFRFDVTPNWVKSRWPRVSTSVLEDGMEGLRVPLVTGTEAWDVHGSLTYFFDNQHQVQRISLYGYTGDATRLVTALSQQYGLHSEPTQAAGLYIRSYNGRPINALRLSHAAVIRSDEPNQQLRVELELNSPHGNYRMSQAFSAKLERERLSGRWSRR